MLNNSETLAEHPSLVQIFDTRQETEAWVIHGLLAAEGIDSVVIPLDAPQDILPGVGGIVVRVSAEDAEAARQAIEDFRQPATDSTEDLEGEVTA